jgi:gliding motility-associated protein GldL
MAQTQKQKKIYNLAYGLGASVVILGALFKLLHWEIGFLTGNVMLAVGLIVEAIIFGFAAFEPVEDDYDWTLAYPELKGGAKGEREAVDPQGLLSKKLDEMLKEAKIDAALMERLGSSIKNFEGAAKQISPTSEAMASTEKYAQELQNAAIQMEALNGLYKSQLESAGTQAAVQDTIAQNAAALKAQMEAMTANLEALNSVYNGMLHAMNRK